MQAAFSEAAAVKIIPVGWTIAIMVAVNEPYLSDVEDRAQDYIQGQTAFKVAQKSLLRDGEASPVGLHDQSVHEHHLETKSLVCLTQSYLLINQLCCQISSDHPYRIHFGHRRGLVA